jgi:2-dehydro-3-deoxygalactonokinase
MTQAALIGVDWGTTNFRAYLLSAEAVILASRTSARGILSVAKGAFPEVLRDEIKDWLQQYPQIPVLMSGMVGSTAGWQEAPYLCCPIDPALLSQHLYALPAMGQHAVYIVPGVRMPDQPRADVMRGEETQLMGVMRDAAIQCCCLPGTHSKWVAIQDQRIQSFTTYMTGELFSLLSQHSILQQQIVEADFNEAAFLSGVAQADNNEGLLANCFNMRAEFLMSHLTAQDTISYLSGLLIGSELLAAKSYWQDQDSVALVASGPVSMRYRLALQAYSVNVVELGGEYAVTHGLVTLAQQAQLI